MATATKNAEIKFRTSAELKHQTRTVYERWGMSLSEAFNLFMRKSIEVGGLPFDVRPEPSIDLRDKAILKPEPGTGMTILPPWADAPEDDGLYDVLV